MEILQLLLRPLFCSTQTVAELELVVVVSEEMGLLWPADSAVARVRVPTVQVVDVLALAQP
jgi:hypothetical protein